MSRLVYSPLESYEVIHNAVEVSCFVCDGRNRHDGIAARLVRFASIFQRLPGTLGAHAGHGH